MKRFLRWIISLTFLITFLVGQSTAVYADDGMKYKVEDYIAMLEELNSKYDVTVEYFDEYYQRQIDPQEIKKYIEDKLQSNTVKYNIPLQIGRAQGKGVKIVEQFPAEVTVYFTYSYSDVTGTEYFSSCDNVTSRTSTAAAISKVVFTQTSYTGKVIDSKRTLAVSVFGTYADYSGFIPTKIDNYKIYFELYYNNI